MAYHLHLVGSKTSHVGIQVPVYTDLSIRQSYFSTGWFRSSSDYRVRGSGIVLGLLRGRHTSQHGLTVYIDAQRADTHRPES